MAAAHLDYDQQTPPLQRIVSTLTACVGRPVFAVALTILVAAWIACNIAAMHLGRQPWDPPPFQWLAVAASLAALYTTILILATQRHDDELARHRAQLTLEIAILSEQKSAKIIQILEQLRQDSPHLENRPDQEAEVMADAADPRLVFDAIRQAHRSARDQKTEPPP